MNGLVQDYLDESVQKHPNKIAVSDGSNHISYRKLQTLSGSLAKLLVDIGVNRNDPVIYYLKRRPECMVATLAILKSGGCYIPLDSKIPEDRLLQIIQDSQPKTIICDKSTLQNAVKVRTRNLDESIPLVSLEGQKDAELAGENIHWLEDRPLLPPKNQLNVSEPDDIAYILYTSGSTGKPKGVMITHRNIRNYIDWATDYFNITSDDQILGTAPFYFDMSTFDIFCALSAGATLHLATGSMLLFPEHLARYIEKEKITLWKGVSSLLMYMCRGSVVRPDRLKTLKTVIFAGEPLPAQYLAEWMQAYPKVGFFNGYGPTEATGVSLCYHVKEIPKPGQKIPIGTPCKGAQVVLLDENDQPVSPGEIGELCISGECLARGYLNDPQKTESSFTPPPIGLGLGNRMYRTGDLVQENPSGDYVFISRKDQQVKWMGYRIELGEIETQMLAHPAIRDAVVLLVEDEKTNLSRLITFFESPSSVLPTTMTKHLAKSLPAYMVPKDYIQMDQLPRNDRGKTDRQKILRWYLEDQEESNHVR
jgi:amino acid adenylation domain-containing protein